MRAETVTHRELLRFQKLVLKMREHSRALRAAYEALAQKHDEKLVLPTCDSVVRASCVAPDSPRP